jgi:hypothetical protein
MIMKNPSITSHKSLSEGFTGRTPAGHSDAQPAPRSRPHSRAAAGAPGPPGQGSCPACSVDASALGALSARRPSRAAAPRGVSAGREWLAEAGSRLRYGASDGARGTVRSWHAVTGAEEDKGRFSGQTGQRHGGLAGYRCYHAARASTAGRTCCWLQSVTNRMYRVIYLNL